MKKNLTFNIKKYIRSCSIKLLIYIFVCIFTFIVLLFLSETSNLKSLLRLILIILIPGLFYLISKFFIDYKYFLNGNFEFLYDKESITYNHFRFIHFFEEAIIPASNYIRIYLEVTRIDKVVLKRGKIHIYGLMTLEKEASKLKQKIINKYTLPDYFKETEEFLQLVNKF